MPSKKAATKRGSKKKVAKKRAAKKPSRKKVVRKKTSKKKTGRKVSKKTSKKTGKKTSTRKKTAKAGKSKAKRKGSRKKVTGKKSASKAKAKKKTKKTAARRSSSKKTKATRSTKKAPSRKKTTASKRKRSASRKPTARRANVLSGPVPGFSPYQPKRSEEYMSDEQLEHFRQILMAWKRELMEEVDRTMHHMKDDASNPPDPNDRATQETEFGLELRTRDRERKLLKKIEAALDRIDDGSYGDCEETGDEIGLRRLEARPVATLCVEAQERRELAEKQFRDREDYYR